MKGLVIFLILIIFLIPLSSAKVVDIQDLFEIENYPEIPLGIHPGIQEGTTTYVYAGELLIASSDESGVEYRHQDLRGSDVNGRQLPFGQELIDAGERFEFTGKELEESGLNYFGARYYDSSVGRFTSVDPAKENHAYTYVLNNPMNFIDPTGMVIEWGPLLKQDLTSQLDEGVSFDMYVATSPALSILHASDKTYELRYPRDMGELELVKGASNIFDPGGVADIAGRVSIIRKNGDSLAFLFQLVEHEAGHLLIAEDSTMSSAYFSLDFENGQFYLEELRNGLKTMYGIDKMYLAGIFSKEVYERCFISESEYYMDNEERYTSYFTDDNRDFMLDEYNRYVMDLGKNMIGIGLSDTSRRREQNTYSSFLYAFDEHDSLLRGDGVHPTADTLYRMAERRRFDAMMDVLKNIYSSPADSMGN